MIAWLADTQRTVVGGDLRSTHLAGIRHPKGQVLGTQGPCGGVDLNYYDGPDEELLKEWYRSDATERVCDFEIARGHATGAANGTGEAN